jgi:hypothetical protein
MDISKPTGGCSYLQLHAQHQHSRPITPTKLYTFGARYMNYAPLQSTDLRTGMMTWSHVSKNGNWQQQNEPLRRRNGAAAVATLVCIVTPERG